MTHESVNSPLIGSWTYRSFFSNPDLQATFNSLEFGRGTIVVAESAINTFKGTIGGPDWSLALNGSANFGNPYTVRFNGEGVVDGEQWNYAYVGYLTLPWPNGVNQRPAIVGSIVRVIPHSNGKGGISPAGEVAEWIAVKDDTDAT